MVRAAREQDLPRILTIYNVARRYMRAHGNTAQWVNGYPSEELLRQDLAAGQLYVLEDGGGVYAVFAFILGEDPTYRRIRGAWRDDSPYGTIHRLGSDGSHRGVFAETAAWAATCERTHMRPTIPCSGAWSGRALCSAASSMWRTVRRGWPMNGQRNEEER